MQTTTKTHLLFEHICEDINKPTADNLQQLSLSLRHLSNNNQWDLNIVEVTVWAGQNRDLSWLSWFANNLKIKQSN